MKENRQSKRIMAFMPEEEPVLIRNDSKQYAAKLVNISSGGALVSVLDCELDRGSSQIFDLFFSDPERMFGVQSEILRTTGRYAAFKFVELTAEKALEIAQKISRMEDLTALLSPTVHIVRPASSVPTP